MLGLAERPLDKIGDMVDNFAYELDTWGHITTVAAATTLSHSSQPPFFSLMVELLAHA